jgi:hypothetical protein
MWSGGIAPPVSTSNIGGATGIKPFVSIALVNPKAGLDHMDRRELN